MKITATYKGVITSVIMIILSVLLFYAFHLPVNGYNQLSVLAVFVIGLLWSQVSLKLSSAATPRFRDLFSEGFKTFIVVALLMVIYAFIFYKLNPQILEGVIKENAALAVKEANHTPAEIADNSNKLRGIFMPMTISISTIKYLLLGALISVIGGVVLSQPNK